MKSKEEIHYECVLKKRTKKEGKFYPKGYVFGVFKYSYFNNTLNKRNIDSHFSPYIVEGHGLYVYFDWSEVEFIKVTKVTTIKKTKARLKQ